MINFLKFNANLCIFSVFLSICFAMVPLAVSASSLYFMPQTQDIYAGDTFIVEARINTDKKEINAIEGVIKFSSEKLKVADIIKGGSPVNLWIKEPFFSNEKGEINFSGGIPDGFNGEGIIIKISFQALADFNNFGEVLFGDNFKVLLNDGKGTADELSFASGNYKIIQKPANLPIISSSSHEDGNIWYANNSLYLRWDLVEGAEYSYILSKDALMEADDIPDRPEGELQWMGDMKYEGLEDGIYYFHLKEKSVQGRWSSDMVFRAMVDKTAPKKITAEIADIEGKQYAVFSAEDKISGIDHYEITETDTQGFLRTIASKDEWKIAANPYLLKDQNLENNIKIKAVDKAGNEQIIEIKKIGRVNFYKEALIILMLCLILILIFLRVLRKKQKSKNDRL